MADITMCSGLRCPLKDTCYRFKAKANPEWQSYFERPPYDKKTGKCELYWKVEKP
jgi:hypothetical protein